MKSKTFLGKWWPDQLVKPKTFLGKWWPDQLAGAFLAVTFALALTGGQRPIEGTGLGEVLPDLVVQAWFAAIALAGIALVVLTQLDRPRGTALMLFLVGALLACNGATVVAGPKGSAALAASGAYMLACIYPWARALTAWDLGNLRSVREASE